MKRYNNINYFDREDTNRPENFGILQRMMLNSDDLLSNPTIHEAAQPINVVDGLIKPTEFLPQQPAPLIEPEIKPAPVPLKESELGVTIPTVDKSILGSSLVNNPAQMLSGLTGGSMGGAKKPPLPNDDDEDGNEFNKFLPMLIIGVALFFTLKK